MIRKVLDDEILLELEKIKKMDVGSDEHKKAVEALSQLLDKKIDFEKLDDDWSKYVQDEEFREATKESENEFKSRELKNDFINKLFSNGITVLGIGLNVTMLVVLAHASFKFEETGSITNPIGKNVYNKVFGMLDKLYSK